VTIATTSSTPPIGPLDPVSLTYGSLSDAWLLAATRCSAPPCAAELLSTTDAGIDWARTTAPAVRASAVPNTSGAVWGVRFADPSDGWIFGDGLWSTHDAGRHWAHIALAVPAGTVVLSLGATSAGTVQAAVALGNGGGLTVFASPSQHDQWRQAAPVIPYGAGPVLDFSFVVSGTNGWFTYNDRGLAGALRMTNSTWAPWPVHCSGDGTLDVGASNTTNVVLYAACNAYGIAGPPWTSYVQRSLDGGTTFRPVYEQTSATAQVARVPVPIASPAPPALVAFQAPDLVLSSDSGHSFHTVVSAIGSSIVDGGFTTTRRGFVIASGANGTTTLWITSDGGHTWVRAPV
jgi:photosystem II stability/assembly factor-like uncharacterized protein